MTRIVGFGLGAALGLLTGCSHMPVTSMIKLARVDFANSDPGQLRAAVRLPRAIRLRTVSLRITVGLSGGAEEAADFRMREVSAPDDVLALHQELQRDTHILAYEIEPAEVARLVAFRTDLKRRQEMSGRQGGTLAIAVKPDACRTGELPGGPVYFTTYLRTQETGGYVPLARDLDLRTVSAGRDLAAEIPPCG